MIPSNSFAPYIDGGGLTVSVAGGAAQLNGGNVVTLGNTVVALTANTTNYVYLDMSLGTISQNTSGFPAGAWPIAVITTNRTDITKLTDSRVDISGLAGNQASTSGVFINVKNAPYNATGNGTTDDSTAVINAIQAAYNAGGGVVFFPTGTYLIASQLSIPNDGAATPSQPAIRLTGSNPSMSSQGPGTGNIPNILHGGSKLDLRNNAATAKIDTRGVGYLEIDHLTLADLGNDSASFVFTTSTTVHIHDCEFWGTTAATNIASAANDAILLGGTSTTIDGSATSPFQGYGTVIRDNHFSNIKRVIVAQNYVNAVQIAFNTVWINCGFITGAAIEFLMPSGSNCAGNLILGNTIEIAHYNYAIKFALNGSTGNLMVGNGLYDDSATTLAAVIIPAGTGVANILIEGYRSSSYPAVAPGGAAPIVLSGISNVGNGQINSLVFVGQSAGGAFQAPNGSSSQYAYSFGGGAQIGMGYDGSNLNFANGSRAVSIDTNGVIVLQKSTGKFQVNSGATWTSGTGVPSGTPTNGSMFSRSDGGVGSTLYVYNGSWVAVA